MLNIITMRNILLSFIIIRILLCLYNIFMDALTLFYLANNQDLFPMNAFQVVLLLVVEVVFFAIVYFDASSLIKIRKKDKTFRKSGLIASIGFSIHFIISVIMRIINLIKFNKQFGVSGMPWYFHYHFNYWDLILVSVFLITVTQIVFLTKFKNKLMFRKMKFAEPIHIGKST